MRRTLTAVVVAGTLLYLGTTLAAAEDVPPPAPPTVAVVAPTAPVQPQTLALELSRVAARYGGRVEAQGALLPAAGGEEVVIEVGGGDSWSQVAVATTDGLGVFAVGFEATLAGSVRARAAATGTVSAPVELAVEPVVRVKARKGRAFAGARLTVVVTPRAYEGRARLVVRRHGKVVGRTAGRVRRGRLTVTAPTPGVGTFWVEVRLPASSGLSERAVGVKVSAPGRTLRVGSRGPEVRALRARLVELHVRVPGPSSTFTTELYDSVIAFQKAYRLSRTGVVDRATWRALERARPLQPRYRRPAHHIEVDKTRQILLEVVGGEVAAILPVSSGATGNTPEGRHAIRWKAPATTTWLGPGILYRTLTFYGNAFAIHGWSNVPAYPASHGCVRIPIWTADWLYNRSPVGETVYVYR